MKFELTILGCGSATPTNDRHPSAQLLNIDENLFLIDCGEGTQLQLRQFHKKFQKIDHIFISHLHGDHYFGLMGLLSTMHLLGRVKGLTIYAPPNLQQIVSLNLQLAESELRFPIKWVELVPEGKNLLFESRYLEIYSFPLVHRIPCTGFLFREKPKPLNIRKDQIEAYNLSIAQIRALKKGANYTLPDGRELPNSEFTEKPVAPKSFAYCSDTAFAPEIVPHIAGVDLLYHESTFLENDKQRAAETLHSTAAQAAEIARAAGAKQLLLGHFSARYQNTMPFVNEAAAIFPNVLIAEEGADYQVGAGSAELSV